MSETVKIFLIVSLILIVIIAIVVPIVVVLGDEDNRQPINPCEVNPEACVGLDESVIDYLADNFYSVDEGLSAIQAAKSLSQISSNSTPE